MANIPVAPVKADPNDPDYIRFRRRVLATLAIGAGLVALTPTTEDDEYFAIIQQILTENMEQAYDVYRQHHPKK